MPIIHPDDVPTLVYANEKGEIKNFSELYMAGRSGTFFSKPLPDDLIPLPDGSELFLLPDRKPIGISPADDGAALFDHDPAAPNEMIQAVAAFMAPAHTAIHSAAYEPVRDDIPPLPLFAYTAVGWHKGRFWVSAFRSDPDNRQDAQSFDLEKIKRNTVRLLKNKSGNRLIQHLGKCCLSYGCPAARNYFLGRWEAPLPTSPVCNARCVGCISLQPSGCCPATQDRIAFVPRVSEITEIAAGHLKTAPGSIVSFGQGCEGEPLLQAEILEKSIRSIRKRTNCGTINLNSNASLPDKIERLAKAGLDSLRASMNSARESCHTRYYRPVNFSLREVVKSIDIMKKAEKFVSLNYFIIPGFTDDPDEFDAFCDLIEKHRPDLIQLRNLNMDPDWYFETVGYNPGAHQPMGIRNWLAELKKHFPMLRFGYFNPSLR
ncbi:MAG: radical SAM protein [Deltaproteobacteria bacterium]|jgi:pyruvate-formate lyase-activating enzyme|nr:radical SAM protein [Deltaproteobacteria bacterium]